MQAIQTKYFGPTNFQGARIKAYSEGFPRGVTVPYEYGASGVEGAHDAAARAFIQAMGWHGVWARGGSVDSKGYVYVCLSRDCRAVYAVGPGRTIERNGAAIAHVRRHVPDTGKPPLYPTEADEMARTLATVAGTDARDLLVVREPSKAGGAS